jgi:hypothetical protein
MATARNVEMNTGIAADEPQPLTYSQITTVLQVGVNNAFIKTNIHNIIKHITSDTITASHIMSSFTNKISCDLSHIFNWLAPYSNLNKLVEDHVVANLRPKGEEFNLAGRRRRMEATTGGDKFNTLVTDSSVHHAVFIEHRLRWFTKNRKRVVKTELEEANKILSSLGVKSSPAPNKPQQQTCGRSRSRSVSCSATPTKSSSWSRSRSTSNGRQQWQNPRSRCGGHPQGQAQRGQGRKDSMPCYQQGARVPFGKAKVLGYYLFRWGSNSYVWSDSEGRYNQGQQQQRPSNAYAYLPQTAAPPNNNNNNNNNNNYVSSGPGQAPRRARLPRTPPGFGLGFADLASRQKN